MRRPYPAVRTLRSPLFERTGEECVPYSFRSHMAKVQLRSLEVRHTGEQTAFQGGLAPL
jgi:hypothetical protein